MGLILRHPNFTDVYMLVLRQYYIPQKRVYKLKVKWMHKSRGWELATERLVMTVEKYNEFKKERSVV